MDITAEKRIFRPAIEVLLENPPAGHDEAAFPAYAHRNPFIEWIFWKRLSVALDFIRQTGSRRVLDFGCGPGIAAYWLATHGFDVTAADVNLGPTRALSALIPFPTSISFVAVDELSQERYANAFDAILALDVLEHVDDLGETLARFRGWLGPQGIIVVSGPTENIAYRIGRRLAGREFTGHYHVSNIDVIERHMRQEFNVTSLASFPPVISLFRVFSATSMEMPSASANRRPG